MNVRLPAVLGVALLASGCLGVLGPEPAPLPPEGEAFTVVVRGCGMQLVPHETVWVSYPDRSLYHFVVAVESNASDQEDRLSGDVQVPYEDAIRVLEQANATGALDLAWYERESRERGYDRVDLWHAELVRVGDEAFRELRTAVTLADLPGRQASYTEPHHVSDGCGIDLVAWTPDGYAHVYRTTMNGPDEVQAFDEVHEQLNPPRRS